MESMLQLEEKVCFVTGSSRGIGWACARLLASCGARVILNGTSSESVAARVVELEAEFKSEAVDQGRHLSLAGDVSDPGTISGFYQTIFKHFGRLDVLINNAGVMVEGLLGFTPADAIDRALRVNAGSVLLNMQEASRLMARKKSGSIINISSIMGLRGAEGLAAYSASKAAVIGATRAAAKELAPRGIRVNALAPGFIDTEMAQSMPQEKFEARLKSIAMKRIGTPEEVAQAAVFLASQNSSYITGQVLGVDGGMIL